MTTVNFVIEQAAHNSSNWEPVPEGGFVTIEEARAAMADLETNLGWRNMRICRAEPEYNASTGKYYADVVEYGLESEESDEE